MAIGIATGIPFRAGGAAYHAEIGVYIAGLVTPLSAGQKKLLNTFVGSLKTGLGIANLSDAFDVMYILGGETAESSLRNLVRRAHDATAVNAPTFTALEGFQGDGISQLLNLNYNPSTEGIKFTRDSASQIVYSRTNNQSNGVMGSTIEPNKCYLCLRNTSDQFWATVNTAGYGYVGVNYNSIGMFIGSRTASNVLNGYKNKVQQTPLADESIPVVNLSHVALGVYRGVTFYWYSTNQLSFIAEGKGFNQAEVNTITDTFEAYMDANGRGIIP